MVPLPLACRDLSRYYVVLGPAAWKPLADYLSTFFLQVEINIPETSLRKEIFKGLLFRSPCDSASQCLGSLEVIGNNLLGPYYHVENSNPPPRL